MNEAWSGNGPQEAEQDDDAKAIARVAAFIFSAHGDDAVEYARRVEKESAVPDTARRVRMEVERLMQADSSLVEVQPFSAVRSESGH